MTETKQQKMLSNCVELSKDAKAFVIIRLDEKGECSLKADGSVFELSFMSKAFDNFMNKILNGEIKLG